MAEFWEVSVEKAKKQNCGNCVAYDVSPRMKECGVGENLGYCWMHNFKCQSARTCNTWAKGGPIKTDKESQEWQERAFGGVKKEVETFEADSKEEARLKKYEKTYGKEGAKVRNRIFKRILAKAQDGTKAGQWSARKAQSLTEEYEKAMGKKGKKPYKSSKRTKSQKSLKDWGDQDWRTKSGKKSSKTGERYLPAKAIKALTDEEYKKTSAKKRKDMKKGKQFSDQPKSIAKKTKKYRAEVKPVGNYSPPYNYDYRPDVGKLNYFFEQVLESASKLEKRKLKRVLGLPNDNPLTKKPMIKAASIVYLMKNDNGIIPKEWYIEYYLKNFTKRQLCYLNDIEYYQGIPITKKELADLLIIGERGMKFESESSKKPSSVEISRSSNPEKKLMAVFYDDEGKKMKTTHFGQRGASDYTKHGDKERMERYLERHGGGFETSTKEDWKDPTTAGSLSRWILWNKPSLKSSFDDYKRRFGLKGSINVSKSAETEEKKKYVLKNPDDYFAMLKEIKANPVPIDWKVKMLEKSFPHTGKTWKRGGQYPEVVVAPNFMTIKMNRQFTDYAYKNRGRGMSQHYDLPPHVQGRSKDGLRVYVGSEYDKGYEGRGVHFIDPAKDILHPILKDRKGEVIETLYLDKDGEIELFTGNTPKDKEIIVPDSLQKIMDDIGATEVLKYMKGRSRLWLSPKIPLENLREGMVLKLNVSNFTGDGLGKIVKIEPKGGGYYDITFDRMLDEGWVKGLESKYQREQIKGLHLGKDRDKIATIFANIDPKDKQQYVENNRFQTKEYEEGEYFTPQIEFDETANSYYATGSPLSPLDKFIRQIQMKQMATENKKPFPFFKMFAVGFAIGIIPLFLDNRRDKV